jgi:hypothetical protein
MVALVHLVSSTFYYLARTPSIEFGSELVTKSRAPLVIQSRSILADRLSTTCQLGWTLLTSRHETMAKTLSAFRSGKPSFPFFFPLRLRSTKTKEPQVDPHDRLSIEKPLQSFGAVSPGAQTSRQ